MNLYFALLKFWMVATFQMVFISVQSPPNAPWIASLFGQYLTYKTPLSLAPPQVKSIQTERKTDIGSLAKTKYLKTKTNNRSSYFLDKVTC